MAGKDINIIEQYVDKAVLGICAVVFLLCVVKFMLGKPNTIVVGSEQVQPAQAFTIAQEKAQQLDRNASREPWTKVLSGKKDALASGDGKPDQAADNSTSLPALVQIGQPLVVVQVPLGPESGSGKLYDLPQVVQPTDLVINVGRSTVDVSREDAEDFDLTTSDDGSADINWVTMAAKLDLVTQRKTMQDMPEQVQKVQKDASFLRIEMQRAQVDIEGKLQEWEDLLPFDFMGPSPDEPLKVDSQIAVKEIRDELASTYSQRIMNVLQPDFFPVLAGTEWQAPLMPGEKRPEQPRGTAGRRRAAPRRMPRQPARGPGGMYGGGAGGDMMMDMGAGGDMMDMGAGGDMFQPGMRGPMRPGFGSMGPARPVTPKISAGELETLDEVKIWAHDVTAKPGKTYRYRLRVILYNPLAGYKPLLKNRDQALLVGITGPWSQPSKPVTMEKATYFFVTGPGDNENSAEVTVYHWNSGWLCRGKFQVAPGQPIGGKQVKTFYQRGKDGKSLIERKEPVNFSTGATMVDVVGQQEIAVRKRRGRADQFNYETQLATAITYLDKQGQMHQQDSANAKNDQGYKSCKKALKDQKKLRRELEIVREGE